ncbi:RNA polymerase sigma factor [Actinoplanes aureus]|uniref:Sigma-70 family RNA polymerase sigma factor n=1 Tax=Actinoplanes aureus TaxID=2792083 RepID=A0A931CB37_9ACTN|nr:sigma-70 family RNA polymerase sigma factor [Actinoplanes aureus]MBG0564142.1 sigma-70 family RNA polymerase sigma factor [Actinoplanes aureus]
METDVHLAARTDAELIAEAGRSPELFAAVFDRHYGRIYAYAARRLGRDLAEDVASETFLVAFTRIDGYHRDRPDAAPWLYGIASNLIARHGRAESRRYRALARLVPDEPAGAHDDAVAGRLDAATERGRLAAALARLSSGERDALLLVAWAGLSQPEVAAALDVPAGTVRSRLHRARQEMRTALGERDSQ